MLKVTAEKRRIKHHITNLDNPDQKASYRAERYLIRYYGSRALEQLKEACQHPNPVVRLRAVWALGYTHDPQAYETILHLTNDPDEGVRYDATLALGVLGDERAIEPLTRILLHNDDTGAAATVFIRMGLKALPALTEALQQGSPVVRRSVLNVLGNFAEKFGDERCLQLLQAYAKDPDPVVREDVEFWLKEINLPSSLS
jgi:HEAT repeat protein